MKSFNVDFAAWPGVLFNVKILYAQIGGKLIWKYFSSVFTMFERNVKKLDQKPQKNFKMLIFKNLLRLLTLNSNSVL